MEDMEKIRRELDEVREKKLFSLQQQVDSHESNFKFIRWVAVGLISFLGLGTVGGWIMLTKYIQNAVEDQLNATVNTQIQKALKEQINPRIDSTVKDVDCRLKELDGRLSVEMDDLVRTNRVFLEVIDEVKEAKLPPTALHRLPKQRIQSDGLFNIYTDALVHYGDYEEAYRLLCELKDAGKFPAKFNWPDSFTQAGLILWVNALSSSESSGGTQEAGRWLRKAERLARENIGSVKMEIRRPLEFLVFLSLSEDKMADAEYYAGEAKRWGTKRADLVGYKNRPWFGKLKRKRPEIDHELEELLSMVFPDEMPDVQPK